jgi:hypothetical protein
VICQPCRERSHDGCPEVARQRTGLTMTELAGSQLCDCQHQAE